MATRKTQTFYADAGGARLRDPATNATLPGERMLLFARDQNLLRLIIQQWSGSAWEAYAVSETAALKFGIKAAVGDADFLAFSDDDQFNVSGDWADASRSGGKLSIRLSCNTTTLLEWLAELVALDEYDAAKGATVLGELQLQEAGEDPVTVLQFPLTIKGEVITGSEAAPEPADPNYVTQGDLSAAVGAALAAKLILPAGYALKCGLDGSMELVQIS